MMHRQNGRQRESRSRVLTIVGPGLIFVAGLLPRFLALDVFLTGDEYLWLGRSRDFLIGVLSWDWGATLQTGHPGVTTMWTGSLGILFRYWTRSSSEPGDLLAFVQEVPSEPLEISYIAPMRFPTVLLISLSVVAFYLLVSRLFNDRRVAAVAALLLALNPFHIALSRVLHHDALATTFMTLSFLPLVGYWLQGWSRRWLVISAVAAGLSFLSKSPAMILMPFCALLGMVWAVRRWHRREWQGWRDVRRLLVDGFLWAVAAWLTVVLLWPAMWVTPIKALEFVFSTGSQYVAEGHRRGNFFLGKITRDPGPLFYPLAWLLRVSPLTLLGLGALVGSYLRHVLDRGRKRLPPAPATTSVLLLYACLFTVFMTLGEKKQDRYILPVYPVLDILGAIGLVYVSGMRVAILKVKERLVSIPTLVLFILFLVLGSLVLANHPYYFTYYNPLLGGGKAAARMITVGWGEGLDQAADYLSSQPNAEGLRVASWYHNSFAPFFRGKATRHDSDAGETMKSDYAVVYRNQIQRELPTTELVQYLVGHYTPAFTATMQGVDYAYVYPLPLARRADWRRSRLPGEATLFGVGEIELGGNGENYIEDNTLRLRLYWQNEGLVGSREWWVAMQPVVGPAQPWQPCRLRSEFGGERLTVGALLESDCQLAGKGLSVGAYHLRVGIGSDPDHINVIRFPEGDFGLVVEGDSSLRLVSKVTALSLLARLMLPEEARAAELVYQGAARLVGYGAETSVKGNGRSLEVVLFWQAFESLPVGELSQTLELEVNLLSPQGTVLTGVRGQFSDPDTWPQTWSTGQVLTRSVWLPLRTEIPPQSQLKLDVWLDGQRLMPLDLKGRPAGATLLAVDAE